MSRRWIPPLADVAFAVVLVAMGIALAVGNNRIRQALFDEAATPDDLKAILAVLLCTVPVAFRRVVPLGALLAAGLGVVVVVITETIEVSASTVAGFVLLVSAGIYGRDGYRDWARAAYAFLLVLSIVASFLAGVGGGGGLITPRIAVAYSGATLAFQALYILIGWYLGDLERQRRHQSEQLTRNNEELADALARLDAGVVDQQRLSLAREVHDVVGHTVSLMGVQAAAARRQVDRDPDAAREMLALMEQQSRDGVEELQALVAMLRSGANQNVESLAAPTARGVEQVADLVDQVRQAGVNVDFQEVGQATMSTAVSFTVYRVVQEALSNAMKYGDGSCEVLIEHRDADVFIATSNGVAAGVEDQAGNRFRTGAGLAGMRERIGLHGGTLTAGLAGNGRFELLATIPSSGRSKELNLPNSSSVSSAISSAISSSVSPSVSS